MKLKIEISGPAGSGKSRALQYIIECLNNAGCVFVGASDENNPVLTNFQEPFDARLYHITLITKETPNHD